MNKYVLPLLFIIVAISVSALTFSQLPEVITSQSGSEINSTNISRWAVAWLIPLVMLVLFNIMEILPRVKANQKYYASIQHYVDTIVISSLISLLIVHCYVIAYSLGYDVNMQSMGPLISGVVFIGVGKYLPKFKRKSYIGFMATSLLVTDKDWYQIKKVNSRVFEVGGLVMLLCALLPADSVLPVFIGILLITVLVAWGISIYYLKRAK